jgi:sulfotransferase
MEKNYRKNPDKARMMTSDAEMRNITTEQRIDTWVNSQPIGLAFQRLHEIIRQGYDKNILFVKFENLTENPSTELNRIYKYLEVEHYSHNFNKIDQITVEDDSVYGIFGDHNIKSEIRPLRPDYKEVLGDGAAQWIKNHYGWFYDYFQYR